MECQAHIADQGKPHPAQAPSSINPQGRETFKVIEEASCHASFTPCMAGCLSKRQPPQHRPLPLQVEVYNPEQRLAGDQHTSRPLRLRAPKQPYDPRIRALSSIP